MKLDRKSFFTLVFLLTLNCLAVYAQNPQQIKILNNYDFIPFEDGKTVIAEINYSGFKYESDVMKLLRDYRNEIKVGELFKGSKISRAVKKIREWLELEGYPNAEINAIGEKLPNNQMKLIFATRLGEIAKVSEIRFEGNENVSNAELVADAKKCIGDSWETFSTRKYEYLTNKCSRSLLSSKGFFRARIIKIVRQPITNGNVVLIEVEEGTRYKLGEIKIEGLSVFSEKQFLEMFGQKTGDVVNGKILREFLYDELSDAYKNIGYLLYDAEIEPEFIKLKTDEQDGLINLKIIIDEGKQYKLLKVKINGVNAKEAQKIRKMLLIKDGEIYNPNKVRKWADKINKMNKFVYFDFEKDVELPTYEKSNYVYLIAKITPK